MHPTILGYAYTRKLSIRVEESFVLVRYVQNSDIYVYAFTRPFAFALQPAASRRSTLPIEAEFPHPLDPSSNPLVA